MFFSFAVRNLRRHWIRSALSIIGIIIGVVAIASLGIMASSINLLLANVITDVGDTLVITPHTAIGETFTGDPRTAVDAAIPAREVEEIRRAANPHRTIPVLQGADEVEFSRGEGGYAQIIGLAPEDIPVLLNIAKGQYLRQNQPGALVGTHLAREYGISPGSRITVGEESIRVAGVLTERGLAADINPDYAIVVSDTWYESHFGVGDGYSMVVVRIGDIAEIDRVKGVLENQFNRREEVVDIFDSRDMLRQYEEIYQQITVFLLGIGGLSLIVAAVNILNVMYISVTERIREIGVMRSIGARRREILRLFLYEALVLGLIGSIVGGIASAISGYLISLVAVEVFTAGTTFGEGFTVFNLSAVGYIVFGIAFGIGTSIAAGFYPAWKASQLTPIEAMRHK
ncbi:MULTISPECIES: ABC transporter permease [unclassified Methanoculleus]|jgi:putative ABC transport system permease protein|uniref:FtsX-like permease family protein n=1 Tax=Methanoculleus palmolei TaxID=72612 RepID=A0ABD8A7R0_9EURY|nr:FtsX-like permease family protein [Methanoculleus sp. UBA377]WOX55190.1 FtsX-like permease family protein [Methanoculleus palmolei]